MGKHETESDILHDIAGGFKVLMSFAYLTSQIYCMLKNSTPCWTLFPL